MQLLELCNGHPIYKNNVWTYLTQRDVHSWFWNSWSHWRPQRVHPVCLKTISILSLLYRSSKKHSAHFGLNVGLAELPTTLRWLCRQRILKCASLGIKGSIGGTIHAEVGIMQHDQSTHTALGFSTRNTYAGVQFHELLLSHHVDHHQELVMQKLWQPVQSPVSSLPVQSFYLLLYVETFWIVGKICLLKKRFQTKAAIYVQLW